jgi:hypothetical protein
MIFIYFYRRYIRLVIQCALFYNVKLNSAVYMASQVKSEMQYFCDSSTAEVRQD